MNQFLTDEETTSIAEEIVNIRNQLIKITDELAMTQRQWRDFEVVKNRLWRVQNTLRELKAKS